MDARTLKSREYNTDVFNVRSDATNGGYGLYDPHPFLRDRQNSDNRTRTSFQDSNIFTYKDGNNVTWQGTGRQEKPAGIKSGVYVNAHRSTDNVIYDPTAPMASSLTQTKQAYIPPTPEMYHNDPTVPKSRLGEEIFGIKQFDRQAARKDLLPNDEYWLRHTDFERDTEEKAAMTPEERKQRDLRSTYLPFQTTPYQPKPKEFKNETLSSWIDPHKSEKRSNIIQDVDTFGRRAQELSSLNNPLSTTDYSEHTPTTKKQESYEDVEKRVKDAFFSDLYGQTGHFGVKPRVTQRSEINSHTGIFSKEGAQKGNRWDENISAAQRRQDFMRSTALPTTTYAAAPGKELPADHEINLARAQLRMPKVIKESELQSTSLHSDEFNKRYNVIQDHREINVISLIFTNLPKDMDAETLKAMSGVKHVVRAAVQTDNIKNECTGLGEITIRLFEGETKEEVVNRFLAAGLDVQDKPEAKQKKSNYNMLATTGWKDHRLEFEEKRHINTGWENDKLSKVQNLSTNVHMGDHEGLVDLNRQYADIIRSGQDGLKAAQHTAEAQNQVMYNWNNMRPQTAGPVSSGAFGGDRAFMQPTQSFKTRSTMVQDSLRKRYY